MSDTPQAALDRARAGLEALQQEQAELQIPLLPELTMRELHERRRRLDEIIVELLAAELGVLRAEMLTLESQQPELATEEQAIRAARDTAEAALKAANQQVAAVHARGSRLLNAQLALRDRRNQTQQQIAELEHRLRQQTGGVSIRLPQPATVSAR